MFSSAFAPVALSLALFATSAAPEASAQKSFEASQEKVLDLVRKDAKDADLEKEVDQFIDYQYLAQQSLGGSAAYESRCAARCDEFESLLTQLIRHNYLSRIRQSDSGSISYTGEEYRKNGTMAKVDTRVDFNKDGKAQSVEVDYVMHRPDDKSGWKVRDIYTDGVGLAKTYRHEFKQMHKEGGIDLLIERLQTKVDSLESNS